MVDDVFQRVDELPHLLAVTRPVSSEGVNASPLRVPLIGMTGMVPIARGWKFSTEKLVVNSWVFVGGGSGASVGGSVIDPGLVPARYTTVILYHNGLNHDVVGPQGPITE